MRTTMLEPSSWRIREVVVVTGTESRAIEEERPEDRQDGLGARPRKTIVATGSRSARAPPQVRPFQPTPRAGTAAFTGWRSRLLPC
ncbi:MAG: hypothetical protein MZU79_06325 [Anaerotruncus sp.]|nr:hypothetical protein [Anaerotruncus sp.]